eukprot:7788178-Pyramimonas_sp.AAC.1
MLNEALARALSMHWDVTFIVAAAVTTTVHVTSILLFSALLRQSVGLLLRWFQLVLADSYVVPRFIWPKVFLQVPEMHLRFLALMVPAFFCKTIHAGRLITAGLPGANSMAWPPPGVCRGILVLGSVPCRDHYSTRAAFSSSSSSSFSPTLPRPPPLPHHPPRSSLRWS